MSKLTLLYCRVRAEISRFARSEDGASGIEYALIAAMVAAILALFVPGVSTQVKAVFNDILTALGGSAVS